MTRAFDTIFAALLGLVFGSFLNVCATRWPQGESIVSPGSHCRSCGRTLGWWENLPLLSWLALRGRCRTCRAWIGWRYPLVEFAVALTWAVAAWQTLSASQLAANGFFDASLFGIQKIVLCWLLVGLAVLDAELLWLPDRLTIGGAVLGLPFALVRFGVLWAWPPATLPHTSAIEVLARVGNSQILRWLLGVIIAPSIILFTGWVYRLVRRREGIGLGDAKLMLLLAVWLGLAHTLLAFILGVALGTAFAFILLFVPRARKDSASWALTRLPLGSFLCIGGIVSDLWGTPLIAAYLHAAGF